MSAFDRVRNPQKIQEGRCSKFITEGFIICRWPTGPRNPPPPNAHRAWLRHADRLWVIVSTFALLGIDSGFTAMSSDVRVPSEFAVHTLLDNFPVESPTDKQTKTHVRSQFISVYGKTCRFTLYGDATTSPCVGCCATMWRPTT